MIWIAQALSAWPAGWDVFNPGDDEHAAREWFTKPQHSVWLLWLGRRGEEGKYWKDLTSAIEATTRIPELRRPMLARDAFDEVMGDNFNSKEHCSLDQKREIGKAYARRIGENTLVGWKQEMASWLEGACIAMAPRIIHLVKRNKKAAPEHKSEPQNKKESVPARAPSLPQAPSRKRKPGQSQERLLSPKKSKVVHHSPVPTTPAPLEGLPPRIERLERPQQTARSKAAIVESDIPFVHRLIMVIADDEAKQAKHPWILVSISTIINEVLYSQETKDVRSQHLSIDKFRSILRQIDGAFDMSREGVKLLYTRRKGESGEIKTSEDFIDVVGLLAWDAEENESTEPLQLVLKLGGKNALR